MAVESLHQRAEEHLRVIRGAMERAGSFTAISGSGGVAMGATALAAAFLAQRAEGRAWLEVWLVAAAVAFPVGVVTILLKARRAGVGLVSGPARLFVFGLAPPIVAGAFLTIAVARAGAWSTLPAIWLSLYGTATVAGGGVTVRPVPVMGVGFIALGAVAAFVPLAAGNVLMAAGFGGLHVGFGILIWRRYGG